MTRIALCLSLCLATNIAVATIHQQESAPFWVQKPQESQDLVRFSMQSGLVQVEQLPHLPNASRCDVSGHFATSFPSARPARKT